MNLAHFSLTSSSRKVLGDSRIRAIERVRMRAQSHADAAREALTALPPSRHRDALRKMNLIPFSRAALSREQQVNGVVHLHEGGGMQAVPEARRGQAAKTMPALIVENDDTLVNAELGDVQARRAGSDNACACKDRPFGGSRYADSALRGLNPVRAAMVADPADYRG